MDVEQEALQLQAPIIENRIAAATALAKIGVVSEIIKAGRIQSFLGESWGGLQCVDIPGRVFMGSTQLIAATGGGFAVKRDGGNSMERVDTFEIDVMENPGEPKFNVYRRFEYMDFMNKHSESRLFTLIPERSYTAEEFASGAVSKYFPDSQFHHTKMFAKLADKTYRFALGKIY